MEALQNGKWIVWGYLFPQLTSLRIAFTHSCDLIHLTLLPCKPKSSAPDLCVWLFVTPWTVAYQAPLSMEFSRQEYWSGLPFPSPGDLPNPEIEPRSPALQADSLPSEPPVNKAGIWNGASENDVVSSEKTVKSESPSVVPDSATPWTIQSMEFCRPEYWSG